MDSFTAIAAADTTSGAEEHSLHLFCAQELNNSAAMYVKEGLYERATSSLHDGLKLLIAMNHHNDRTPGSFKAKREPRWHSNCDHDCDHPCTLDGCIAFSEQTSFLFHSGNTDPKESKRSRGVVAVSHKGLKKQRLSRSKETTTSMGFQTTKNSRGSSNGYVYPKPIRIPLEGFCHCYKGYTSLLVVIVFNLAIAHHLNVMDGSSDAKTEHIAFLYRLCLELLHQASPSSSPSSTPSSSPSPSPLSLSPSSITSSSPAPRQLTTGTTVSSTKTSIRCETIIHNNLSQLHRTSGNLTQHRSSLEDLLSSLMVLIERGTRECTSNIGYWWDANRWSGTQNGQQSELVKGVLENLSPLILREHCADAA